MGKPLDPTPGAMKVYWGPRGEKSNSRLLPGVGAWGVLMAKNGLRAAGYGSPHGPAFTGCQNAAASTAAQHCGKTCEACDPKRADRCRDENAGPGRTRNCE